MSFLLENVFGLVDKVEEYDLSRDVLLPKFNIPDTFKTKSKSSEEIENEYRYYLNLNNIEETFTK